MILTPRQRSDGTTANQTDWCLVAGELCFPTNWVLRKKMGKPQATIQNQFHNIPKCSVITLTVFFTAWTISTISMRINLSLQTDGALYAPVRLNLPDPSLEMSCDQIHLRVERQTLRKLPQTGNVLFAIRTNLAPVSAWQGNEGAIENLLFILGNMTPEVRHYKGAAIYEASSRNMLRNK